MTNLVLLNIIEENHYLFGAIGLIAVGVFLILAAKYKWDWMLNGPSNGMDIQWFSNVFGTKVGRFLLAGAGVVMILCAFLVLAIVYLM